MSRGIGKTQRRILDELAANDRAALTVIDLAEWIGVSDRQMRRAVHVLADRGLVVLTKENGGWTGEGRYGPFKAGESRPARRDTEFYHIGMPTGVSLFVWLPEERAKWLEMDA
jgi:predicted ArsR family transcriptional regulator